MLTLLSDGGAPKPSVFLPSSEPVPPPLAAVAAASPAVFATTTEDTAVDDKDNADDNADNDDIYKIDAIQTARSQVRSGTVTTVRDFNNSVGRTARQLCAAALGRVSTYNLLDLRNKHNIDMRVLETGALLNVPSWSGGPRVNKRIVSVEDNGSSEFTVVTSDGISHSSR